MLRGLKRGWADFKKGRPGHRFQDRYQRKRQGRHKQSPFLRLLQPIAAVVLIAAGIILCVIPGPGLPLIIVGLGLLAERWLGLARALDWAEVRVRRFLKSLLRWWKAASIPAKVASSLVVGCVALGGAYLAYQIMFGRN